MSFRPTRTTRPGRNYLKTSRKLVDGITSTHAVNTTKSRSSTPVQAGDVRPTSRTPKKAGEATLSRSQKQKLAEATTRSEHNLKKPKPSRNATQATRNPTRNSSTSLDNSPQIESEPQNSSPSETSQLPHQTNMADVIVHQWFPTGYELSIAKREQLAAISDLIDEQEAIIEAGKRLLLQKQLWEQDAEAWHERVPNPADLRGLQEPVIETSKRLFLQEQLWEQDVEALRERFLNFELAAIRQPIDQRIADAKVQIAALKDADERRRTTQALKLACEQTIDESDKFEYDGDTDFAEVLSLFSKEEVSEDEASDSVSMTSVIE